MIQNQSRRPRSLSLAETEAMRKTMTENFGGNLTINPTQLCRPRSETELLRFLNDNRGSNIRAIGRLHSWSKVLQADEAVVDMSHFDSVELDRSGAEWVVRVGAGCQIKDVLKELQSHGLTLPTLGLIDEQSVAGAIATGTHGSGRQSLSHFVRAVRVASFSGEERDAELNWINATQPLRRSLQEKKTTHCNSSILFHGSGTTLHNIALRRIKNEAGTRFSIVGFGHWEWIPFFTSSSACWRDGCHSLLRDPIGENSVHSLSIRLPSFTRSGTTLLRSCR